MRRSAHVGLTISEVDERSARELRGIRDYAIEHDWSLTFFPVPDRGRARTYVGWPGDGMIAMAITPSEIAAMKSLSIPVVNLAGTPAPNQMPRVIVDDRSIGRKAARHLLDRGFVRFAFYGQRGSYFAQQRKRGFVESVESHGYPCASLEGPRRTRGNITWQHWIESLEKWLGSLELPVGLMAVNDSRASLVVEACSRFGIRVPEDVAVIGVGNMETTCEFCRVPLTSVERSGRAVGREAASLLDRLIAGNVPPDDDILIPPEGIVRRRSTDVVAVEDPYVAKAVGYVREHVDEVFGVETLERIVPVTRRWLEHQFKEHLRCTPHEFICRTRVEKAKQLLARADNLSMRQISRACGFSDPHRFRLVFRRLTGMKPTEYRCEHRRKPAGT